ncbi:MAG: hypothetical protein ACRCUS_02305, partial [Anaerovoracaceae bacterium]
MIHVFNAKRDAIKNIIYAKRIWELISISTKKILNLNYDEAYENDRKMIAVLDKMIIRQNNRLNSLILSRVAVYILTIDKMISYDRDRMSENESLLLFSNYFLKDDVEKIKHQNYKRVEIIHRLIIANCKQRRRYLALEIYLKYKERLNFHQKSKLFSEWSEVLGGYLPFEDILEYICDAESNHCEFILDIVDRIKVDKPRVITNKIEKYINTFTHYVNVIYKNSIGEEILFDEKLLEEKLQNLLKLNEHFNIEKLFKAIQIMAQSDNMTSITDYYLALIEEKGINDKILYSNVEIFKSNRLSKTSSNKVVEKYLQSNVKLFDKRLRSLIMKIEKSETNMLDKKKAIDNILTLCHRKMKNMFMINNISAYINLYFKYLQVYQRITISEEYNNTLKLITTDKRSNILLIPTEPPALVNSFSVFPLLMMAIKSGAKCYGIYPESFDNISMDFPSIKDIMRNSQMFQPYIRKHKWIIDVNNKKISANGINYFQPIFDRVARWNYSYFMKLDENSNSRVFLNKLIDIYDYHLLIIQKLQSWSKDNNFLLRFVSDVMHTNPASPYSYYCDA